MATVVALTCPVCGAPFPPEGDRCGYCGSIVVLKTDHPRIDPRMLNKLVVDEHIAGYRKAVRADPSDATAHYGLGVAYFNLGLIDEAVDELTQAARLMPENPNIQAQLAVVLRESARRGNAGAGEQMHRRIETALHLDPNHAEARMLRGQALLDDEDYAGAVAAFRELDAVDAERSRPRLVEALEGEWREAVAGREWQALRRVRNALAGVDEERARGLMSGFLRAHEDHVPKIAHSGNVHQAPPRRALAVAGYAVAAFVAAFVVLLTVTALTPDTPDGESMAAWVAILILLAVLLLLASPFAGGIVGWRRSARVRPTSSQSLDRPALFAGTAGLADMRAATDAVLDRLLDQPRST